MRGDNFQLPVKMTLWRTYRRRQIQIEIRMIVEEAEEVEEGTVTVIVATVATEESVILEVKKVVGTGIEDQVVLVDDMVIEKEAEDS